MKIEVFRAIVRGVGYGKNVVDAVYVHPSDDQPFLSDLSAEIRCAKLAAEPRGNWNLLKFHLREYAITFLSYPDFNTVCILLLNLRRKSTSIRVGFKPACERRHKKWKKT